MSHFASILRTAALSIALGASAFAALPVQAAGVHMGFGFGDDFFKRQFLREACFVEMSDYAVRQEIIRHGYTNVALNVRNEHKIQVRGTKGGWVYLLTVGTCTGAILETRKLRKA